MYQEKIAKNKNKVVAVILFLIIALGAIIRFSVSIKERDFWYDEAFTGILLKAPFSEMNQMIFDDVHPPLYYWLAKPWAAIFNYSPIGIRSFSAVLGLILIFSVFWIVKEMVGRNRAGLLAAIIASFSPFAIQYSQEARMYMLFALLMLWATFFFYKALVFGKRKDWIWWGILGGLSFYTHYLSLFFFVIFYLTFVFYQKFFLKEKFLKSLLGKKNFWLGTGIIFLFFLSWIKVFISHMMKGNLGWIDVSYLSDLPKTIQIFFFGHPPGVGGVPSPNSFRFFFDDSSVGLLILLAIIVIFTYAWIKEIRKKEIFILGAISFGTLLFLILLSHLNIKLYVSRYFMPAAILIYALTAILVVEVFQQRMAWLGAVLVYAVMLAMLSPIKFYNGWYQLYNFDDDALSNKIVVASNPFDYTTAKFYFGEKRVRFYNRGNPSEDFSGWVVVGNDNKIEDIGKLKGNGDFVIVSEKCDWEELGLFELGRFDQLAVCAP